MTAYNRSIALTLLLASSVASLTAQQVKSPGYHTGEQVHYDMRVGGPETNSVGSAYFLLRLSNSSVPDQEGLQSSFTTGWIPKGTDESFHADLIVPPHLASGDYVLTVMLRATPGTTVFRYDRSDLKLAPVHIDSEEQLQRPEITISERR